MTDKGFLPAAGLAAEWIASYRRRLPGLAVLPTLRPGEVAARIPEVPPEEGESLEAILVDLDDHLLDGMTHWNHPGFFAYFCSSTTDAGILAEFIAAELNQNAMLWRTSPAATELEERVVGWVRRFVGLPDDLHGVILDTASTSSFTALTAARERAVPGVRSRGLAGRTDLGRCTLYVSDQAHSSLDKSAVAAGLGLENVRRIGTDTRMRMNPRALDDVLNDDRAAGATPIMVCATIGTTSTTSVDPVDEIADVCREHDVWLHVDAAYAGPAAALPELSAYFAGWERADSIVLNPHKWMSTPIDCSVLLYRDPEAMRRSLAVRPHYLSSDEGGADLMDVGLPLGRRFRALKLWFLFRHTGAAGLRSMLRDHIRLASEFAEWLEADSGFEVVGPHPFSLVCFRAIPPAGADPDHWNRRLLDAVNRRGRVFLSHAIVEGLFTLRMAVGSARVTRDAVRTAYRLLAEEHETMLRDGGEREQSGGERTGGS
jgi:aromatic-L-amino-acid decarboxylase